MQIRGVAVRRYVSVTRLILKHTYLEVYTDRQESKTAILRGEWVCFLSGNTFMALDDDTTPVPRPPSPPCDEAEVALRRSIAVPRASSSLLHGPLSDAAFERLAVAASPRRRHRALAMLGAQRTPLACSATQRVRFSRSCCPD